MDCDTSNLTAAVAEVNVSDTRGKEIYEAVHHWFYKFGLPTVCMGGFLGNVLNLWILTGKRIQRALRMTERAANDGLIALAISDLIFCLFAFPSSFLPEDPLYPSKGFLFYYNLYCAGLINIFIMSSTWLTVTMASERYIAICHPLKARKILSMRRSRLAMILVFILSITINIPVFWRYKIRDRVCNNVTIGYSVIMQDVYSENFETGYRTAWATIGNFIPLIILLYCNVCLIRQIHKTYAERKRYTKGSFREHQESDTSNRVTLTLVSIVVMFLVLVAPSELIKIIAKLAAKDLEHNFVYLTIEVITNVMQTINFSANFILYCCVNPSFRRTMKHMFFALCAEQKVDDTSFSQYETCNLSTTPESIKRKKYQHQHHNNENSTISVPLTVTDSP